MKDGRALVVIHTRARIIKEATGAARTICSSGENNAFASRKRVVSTARAHPAATAHT